MKRLRNKHLDSIKTKTGIYLLYDEMDTLVYVGKSMSLGIRIGVSAARYEGIVSYKYYSIENLSDMDLYELVLISIEKPKFNKDCFREDKPTILFEFDFPLSDRYYFENIAEDKSDFYYDQQLAWDIAYEISINRTDRCLIDGVLMNGEICSLICDGIEEYSKKF